MYAEVEVNCCGVASPLNTAVFSRLCILGASSLLLFPSFYFVGLFLWFHVGQVSEFYYIQTCQLLQVAGIAGFLLSLVFFATFCFSLIRHLQQRKDRVKLSTDMIV